MPALSRDRDGALGDIDAQREPSVFGQRGDDASRTAADVERRRLCAADDLEIDAVGGGQATVATSRVIVRPSPWLSCSGVPSSSDRS